MTIVGAALNGATERRKASSLVIPRSAGEGLLERRGALLFQDLTLARDGGQDAHSVTHAAALPHPFFMVDRERLRKPFWAS